MSNKNKNAAAAAMEDKGAAPNNEKKQAQDMVTVMNSMKSDSLSQDSKATVAGLIQKRWIDNPKANPALIEGANILVDSLLGDIVVTSFVRGEDFYTQIIRDDENKYLAISSTLAQMGIKMPSFKELPAPTEEQLKQAGLLGKMLPAESRVVTISKKDVSKEALDKKKAEEKIQNQNSSVDPTKIENDDQLKAALATLMTDSKEAPDARIQKAIVFYHSYLEVQANKSENKEEELKKIAELSRPVMLKQIADRIGDCPFAFMGIGSMLSKAALETGSPVAPFKLYKSGAKGLSDDVIADMVKALIVWSCNTRIKGSEDYLKIADEKLKKDPNDEKTKQNVAGAKKNIEEQNKILGIVTNPTFDVVESLIKDYNAEDESSDEYNIARRLVRNVKDLYYKKVDLEKTDMDVFLSNCQQYAGIITNLFCDPLSKSINYSESNLTELKDAEPTPETEKKEGEGDAKNA